MSDSEEVERLLDPHRDEARHLADQEVTARLRSRGIEIPEGAASADLADLMTAVERFEALVEAEGGDLMVNDLNSSAPDDPHFVLPQRRATESLRGYARRVEAAALSLRGHTPHTE